MRWRPFGLRSCPGDQRGLGQQQLWLERGRDGASHAAAQVCRCRTKSCRRIVSTRRGTGGVSARSSAFANLEPCLGVDGAAEPDHVHLGTAGDSNMMSSLGMSGRRWLRLLVWSRAGPGLDSSGLLGEPGMD